VKHLPLPTLTLVLLAMACGGESKRQDAGGASAGTGGASAGAGGACTEPAVTVPELPPFTAPPVGQLDPSLLTFRNRCAETVWPAWDPGGGLDNTVVESEVWLPLHPDGGERTVTMYGTVHEIAFWGRTGCSFDQAGSGACRTGDCGGFDCSKRGYSSPANTTVFDIFGGFRDGYNLPLRVEGATCGSHECIADLDACSNAAVVRDGCGGAIACGDVCGKSNSECCTLGGTDCSDYEDGNRRVYNDLTLTFCP
jgi:hypothetical protein